MAARSKGSRPYAWHPLVHKLHFDEKLYFVLIRLKDPVHVPVAQQVRDLLRSAGIEYASEYVLFGWYDALIRVWLKAPAYERLIDALPEDILGFTVDRIHYLWHGNRNLLGPDAEILGKINGAKGEIDAVAKNPDDTSADSWRKLYLGRPKLVFDRSPTNGGVKFYTLLERTSDRVAADRQIEQILTALNETRIPHTRKRMSSRATLYCGKGELANYLVRCVATTFEDVLTVAEEFDVRLKEAQVRPVTRLVANPQPPEFDHPNDPVHLSLDDRNMAEMLTVDEGAIDELDEHYRVELRKLVSTACSVADDDTDLRLLLLDLLRATVANESDKVSWYQSLVFLAEFEPIFGKRVEAILARELGKGKWFAKIKTECEQSPDKDRRKTAEAMEKGKRLWDLGNYKFLALAAAEFHPKVRGRLEGALGDTWAQEVESLNDLRNEYLHGRNYEQQLNAYDDEWTGALRRLIDAALFWHRCSRGRDDSPDDET